MKLEAAGLRTWWLGGIALWALAIWIATLFGLGSRIAPATDGDIGSAPLPSLAPAAPERMASASTYAQIGARPLFAEDRQPRPYLLGGTEQGTASSVSLTGVLLTSEFAMAILTTDQRQSLRLRLNGDAVNGWQLLALEPRRATVSGPGGTQTLELQVFNGQGGEPPTVLGTTQLTTVPPAGAGARPNNGVVAPMPAPPPPPTATPAPLSGTASNAAGPAQNSQGPSEDQMKAIRERIQARRQQLQQQQQQQQQQSQQPPAGGSGHNP
ncbi:general secretion pathway protein N [Stenotrophomonas rhizophila]|uniref:general secretion pathway protein GspN n=1 Tax=Stenotrophomonas rhizophila TaxID=216778 RepID=UPI000F4B657A|nr:general secretion pathway protein GspN [Stenotrophomonas rhizophila]ROP78991.1 general secretion pathway protein N [Stenotrophomonas rhizophila]